MKALTFLSILAASFLAGCAQDKSSDTQTYSTPPAKSQMPGGANSNIPPQAMKGIGGGK